MSSRPARAKLHTPDVSYYYCFCLFMRETIQNVTLLVVNAVVAESPWCSERSLMMQNEGEIPSGAFIPVWLDRGGCVEPLHNLVLLCQSLAQRLNTWIRKPSMLSASLYQNCELLSESPHFILMHAHNPPADDRSRNKPGNQPNSSISSFFFFFACSL